MIFFVIEGDFPFWRSFVLNEWQRQPHRTVLLTQTPALWPHDDYDVVEDFPVREGVLSHLDDRVANERHHNRRHNPVIMDVVQTPVFVNQDLGLVWDHIALIKIIQKQGPDLLGGIAIVEYPNGKIVRLRCKKFLPQAAVLEKDEIAQDYKQGQD